MAWAVGGANQLGPAGPPPDQAAHDTMPLVRWLPAALQASTAQNTLEPLRPPTDNKAKDEDMEEERKCHLITCDDRCVLEAPS